MEWQTITKWIIATSIIFVVIGGITIFIEPDKFKIILNDDTVKVKYSDGLFKAYNGRYLAFEDSIQPYYWNGKGYVTMYKNRGAKYSNLSYHSEDDITYVKQTIYYSKGNLTRYFEITEYKVKESFEWDPIDSNLRTYFVWTYSKLDEFKDKVVYVDKNIRGTQAEMDFKIINNWEQELDNIVRVERFQNGKLKIRTRVFEGNAFFDPEIILGENSDDWAIIDDTVFMEDSNVYLSSSPHTISSPGWVYFNLTSKHYSGNIDAVWGFNSSNVKPKKAELYKPHYVNWSNNHTHSFQDVSDISVTSGDCDYGNEYNNHKRNISYMVCSKYNETSEMCESYNQTDSVICFDSYENTEGNNYTITWQTDYSKIVDWVDFTHSFNQINRQFQGMNQWYYIKDVAIENNKSYQIRMYVDMPIGFNDIDGKYFWGIKISSDTLTQAIDNDRFYYLDPWYNSSWTYKKNITINSSKVNGTQTNFPVLISMTDANLSTSAQNDGDDIVFTNTSGTKLDHEIEFYNGTTGELQAWVRIPSLSGSTDTVIQMYYGNAGASNQENVNGVWDSNFKMVQHMQETDIDGGAGDIKDSTSYGNNGTTSGMNTSDQVAGQIDGCLDFDGNDDHLTCGSDNSLDITALTISLWINPNSVTTSDNGFALVSHRGGGGGGPSNYAFVIEGSYNSVNEEKLMLAGYNSGWFSVISINKIIVSQSQQISITVDSSDNYVFYINGQQNGSGTLPKSLITNSNNLLRIARSQDTSSPGGNQHFNGTMDEVRISNTSRSAGWIKTEYDNQNSPSTFYTVGAEEADSYPYIDFTTPTPVNDTTTSNTSIQINVSITESNLDEIKWNWNGTNYTMYDDKLVLGFNFDNISAFEECSDWNCLVYDFSGNENHGNLTNITDAGHDQSGLPQWISGGKYNGAFQFTTTDFVSDGQSIHIPHSDSLNPGDTDFAMMFWFKCDYCLDSDISRKGSTATHNAGGWYKMEVGGYGDADVLSLQFRGPGASPNTATLQSTQDVCDDNWHFGLGQRIGDLAELWIDGVNQTSFTAGEDDNTVSGSISNTANLTIGSKDTQDDDFFNGTIDEYRIYVNRSFTKQEIEIMYLSNLNKYDTDNWTLYLNQSKNTTDGLDDGIYTYQTFVKNIAGNLNNTEERTITISTATPWYNSSWSYKKNITINSSKVNGTQTNFPILINITDTDLRDDAQADGDDIVFVNSSGSKLDHEIEFYNGTTGELQAWVRIPSLSGSTDTVIQMYYGNAAASNQENVNDVWDSNFLMVQHLQETPAGTTYDSTSNGNNGTTSGMDSADQVAGQIDGSLDFDGTNDHISLTKRPVPTSGDEITFSAWISTRSFVVNTGIIKSSNSNKGASFRLDGTSLDFYIGDGSSYTFWDYSHGMIVDTFYYVVATYDGTTGIIYKDGASIGSTIDSFTPNWGTEVLTNRFISDDPPESFNGTIDEVRASNVARSSGWIKTEYDNQNSPSTFYTVGVEEAESAEDTCTYSGSGTWHIDCSDNCELVATDMGGEQIIINQSDAGQGNITFAGNVSNHGNITTAGYNSSDKCWIRCDSGGCFI